MAEKMFSPGDVVRMKPIEEVKQIVQKYWPNSNNKDYIKGLLKYSNKIVTVVNIIDIQLLSNNLKTYYIVPETYNNSWTLLQDYFELYSIKINNNIPDLFGM